jgi:hypothetical protein
VIGGKDADYHAGDQNMPSAVRGETLDLDALRQAMDSRNLDVTDMWRTAAASD